MKKFINITKKITGYVERVEHIHVDRLLADWRTLLLRYLAPALMAASLAVVVPTAVNKIVNAAGEVMPTVNTSPSYNVVFVARKYFSEAASSSNYKFYSGSMQTAFFTPLSVLNITPSNAYNSGTVAIAGITGTNFVDGMVVRLSRTGELDINATDVSVESASKITCKFDLTGRKTGAWDVVITNPTGNQVILSAAFTINTWANFGALVNYPNPFNPAKETTTLIYKLAEDKDTTVLLFDISTGMIWRREFFAGTNGGRAGDNNLVWNGMNDFGEMAANGIYFCRVIDKNTGSVLAKGRIGVLR